MIAYGLIPEFVGRFPVLCPLQKLSEPELVHVLREPRGALTRQYAALFSHHGVPIFYTRSALEAVAHLAYTKNTGARGLRSILETTLRDAMFEAPSMIDDGHPVAGVVLDAEGVTGGGGAKVFTER